MELYLCRHGDYIKETVDPQQPLSELGIVEVQKMGRHFKSRGMSFQRIFHSSKKRAAQTAEILRDIVRPGIPLEMKEYLKPHDDVAYITRDILLLREDTMIVGHLPFLSHLLVELLGRRGTKTNGLSMPPASVVILRKDEQGRWDFVSFLDPSGLPGTAQ